MYATMLTKAAVAPGSTLEPSFAAPLAVARTLQQGFVGFAMQATFIQRLLQMGARQVPFNVSVPAQSAGGTYRFVGQTAPVPASNLALSAVTLAPTHADGTIVISSELARLSTPSAEVVVRNDMASGVRFYIDQTFTDPTNAGVLNEKPASILATAPSFGSAGPTSANAQTDLKKAIGDFFTANPRTASPVFLMSPATAAALIIATGETNLNAVVGGQLMGIPTLTGSGIGNRLALVDAEQLIVADEGDMTLAMSRQGTVELNTTPTSPITASTISVNLWQQNLIGLKAQRWINWKLGNPNAALWTTVSYV
jgi:HK97 family phage major capsid protein